jgi:predicted Fe-Mo cluster-binding NifX family protein
MRIAVPSDDGINVAAHTGRAQGFVIYDIKDQQALRLEYRTNSYTAHAQGQCAGDNPGGQHEHQSHGELLNALQDVQIMIARGMGQRLVTDLASRNIKVVFSDQDNSTRAAELYALGQLTNTGKSCCDHKH